MKRLVLSLLTLLGKKEKSKLVFVIVSDFLTGLADILFMGMLLAIMAVYMRRTPIPGAGNLSLYFARYPVLGITVFLVLFTAKNWLAYRSTQARYHFFYRVASRLSKKGITASLQRSFPDFTGTDSSVLMHRTGQQPVELVHYVLSSVQQLVSQGFLILSGTVLLLVVRPPLLLLLLVLLLPPVLLLGALIRNRSAKVRQQTKSAGAKTLRYLKEALGGYTESNLYHKHDFLIGRYASGLQQLNHNLATQQSLQSLSPRLVEVICPGRIVYSHHSPFLVGSIACFQFVCDRLIYGGRVPRDSGYRKSAE